MHAPNFTSDEVAVGSELWRGRSAVEDSRKIQFKRVCIYEVIHSFSKITVPLTLHVEPGGEFTKLDLLTIMGIWIWKGLGSLENRSAGGGAGNCQCLSLVLGGARVAFQDMCWTKFRAKTITRLLVQSTCNFGVSLCVVLSIQTAWL